MRQASSLALEQAALATQSARVPKGSSLSITSKPSRGRQIWTLAEILVALGTKEHCGMRHAHCCRVGSTTKLGAPLVWNLGDQGRLVLAAGEGFEVIEREDPFGTRAL